MIPKAISMDARHIAFLLSFFILYILAGGFIFQLLEAPKELQMRAELKDALLQLRDVIDHLRALQARNQSNTAASELTSGPPTPSSGMTERTFENLIHQLLEANDNNLIDVDGHVTSLNWNLPNAVFFTLTVVTTIGYGHLSPASSYGKVFCVFYALFGIPMTGILLGAIGDRFSRCFLNKVHKTKRRIGRNDMRSVRLTVIRYAVLYLVPWALVFLILPAGVFTWLEQWSFLESFYYCFISLSTIGFGDYVAGQQVGPWLWAYKVALVLWIIFGLSYLSMILNFISQGLRSHRLHHGVMSSIRRISPHSHHHGHHHGHHPSHHTQHIGGGSTNQLGSPASGGRSPALSCPSPGLQSSSPTPSPNLLTPNATPHRGSPSHFNIFAKSFLQTSDTDTAGCAPGGGGHTNHATLHQVTPPTPPPTRPSLEVVIAGATQTSI